MNERDMTDLLQRASRDLAPDVHALVAGGLERGQVRRRRRMAMTSVAASTAVVLLTVGGVELVGAGHVGTRGIAPANPSTDSDASRSADPTQPAGPTRSPERGPVRPVELAVTTAQVPETFASLQPGAVSDPSPRSGPDSAPVVDFTWQEFGVRVGLTPDDYLDGHRVPDPARRCAEQEGKDRCRPRADGTVVARSSGTSPEVDGGTSERSVTVFRPDGWDVLVIVYNGPGKEGPPTAAEPPLSLSQLQRIASSDAWFR